MKCVSWASLLVHTFASPCLGCEPKARVTRRKVILRGKIQKLLMFKLQENERSMRNSLTMRQKDPLKDEDVFALINTSIMNTSIVSSFGLNVVVLNEDDNKKINEELWHIDLPIVLLGLYSLVCRV
jgi:hypothetical protein